MDDTQRSFYGLKFENAFLREKGTAFQTFAGGMDGEPGHQAAVLAVMSYFFERCDIFEDVVQDVAS